MVHPSKSKDSTRPSIPEILESKEFEHAVEKYLNDLIHKRILRPVPPPGYKNKRDVYDQMSEDQQLGVTFFISEYKKIIAHKSKLSASRRNLVSAICYKALHRILTQQSLEKAMKKNQR